MQRIVIKNFGPITNCELDINDLMLFIGEQASGKSTICKCVYFFKSIRDDVKKCLLDTLNTGDFDGYFDSLDKLIAKKFIDLFESPKKHDPIYLQYYYKDDCSITVTMDDDGQFILMKYSPLLYDLVYDIMKEAVSIYNKIPKLYDKFGSFKELDYLEQQLLLEYKVNEIFGDDRELIFIPAGRSLVSTLSSQLVISTANFDYLTGTFFKILGGIKRVYRKSIDDIVLEQQKTTNISINYDVVSKAKQLMLNVLKGEYRNESDGEKIYIHGTKDKFVWLDKASSGQQEAIWILYLLFYLILEQRKVFMIIEEPEAHLYPFAQREIVKLIGLFANTNNNQVLITTHSPYILTSTNNLLYANKVGQEKQKQVEEIIEKDYWLDVNRVSAYMVGEKEYLRNIIDEELKEIAIEEIDRVSKEINKEYDRIFVLED